MLKLPEAGSPSRAFQLLLQRPRRDASASLSPVSEPKLLLPSPTGKYHSILCLEAALLPAAVTKPPPPFDSFWVRPTMVSNLDGKLHEMTLKVGDEVLLIFPLPEV